MLSKFRGIPRRPPEEHTFLTPPPLRQPCNSYMPYVPYVPHEPRVAHVSRMPHVSHMPRGPRVPYVEGILRPHWHIFPVRCELG